MPKLWNETIETHRHAVREAILEATWSLVADRGPMSVSMSQIAEKAGIGRATLYKYFPDVESILTAFHERHVTAHLEQLTALKDGPGSPGERLKAVLEAYAFISHHRARHGTEELSALLHRGETVVQAERQLTSLFRDLLAEVADSGGLRDDTSPAELASYCLHALTAAADLPTEAAVRRLVTVTLAGMHP